MLRGSTRRRHAAAAGILRCRGAVRVEKLAELKGCVTTESAHGCHPFAPGGPFDGIRDEFWELAVRMWGGPAADHDAMLRLPDATV